MTNLPKLYYFDLPNRGEAIRLALHIGNVPFEDVRFSFDEWNSQYKKLSPNGKAPWLILDAYSYIESQPILLWASALTHLLPREAASILAAKTLVDACDPLWLPLAFYYWQVHTDAEGYNQIHPHLKQIETQLSRTQSSEGYSVSAGLSFADLVIAVVVWNLLNIPVFHSQYHQPSFPRMCRVYSLVMSHPAVINYWKNTRHPLPVPLGPISLDYYRNITSEAGGVQTRGMASEMPLLLRPDSSPDGSDAVSLLLALGDVKCEESRSRDMGNRIELRLDNVSYTKYYGIILWAAAYARLLEDLNPEEALTANIVACQCCEVYELYQQCATTGSTLMDEREKIEEFLQVIEKTLQQSSMSGNWSDVCVVVLCALLRAADYPELQQSHPYIYLKKIQAPSLHPKIEDRLNQLVRG